MSAEADTKKPPKPDLRFRPRHRLTHKREFDAVFAARLKAHAGPLSFFVRANELPEHRLGLSVSRKVGNAIVRNRVKRRLRESFRLNRSRLPMTAQGAFDIVVSVRKHDGMKRGEYEALLLEGMGRIERILNKRAARAAEKRGGHGGV